MTHNECPKTKCYKQLKNQFVRHSDNDLNYLNGLKILGGRFSRRWTKRSDDGELALDDAGLKKTMSIQKREMVSGERQNTRYLDLCVPILSMPFMKLNGAEIKWRES